MLEREHGSYWDANVVLNGPSLMKMRLLFVVMFKTQRLRWIVLDTDVIWNACLLSATHQLNLSSRFASCISIVGRPIKRSRVFHQSFFLTVFILQKSSWAFRESKSFSFSKFFFKILINSMAPKEKHVATSSSSVTAAPATVGGFPSQEAPIFDKWKWIRHWTRRGLDPWTSLKFY